MKFIIYVRWDNVLMKNYKVYSALKDKLKNRACH